MGPAVSSYLQGDLRSAGSGSHDASRSLENVFGRIMRMVDFGPRPNEAADDRRALLKVRGDLEKLARRELRERDTLAIENAVEALDKLLEIQDSFETLRLELAEIDKLHEVEEADDPNQKSKIDLLASVFSLKKVCDFLVFSAPSESLTLLRGGLDELIAGGANTAMFAPLVENYKGRPSDSRSVLSVKGALAGMMHAEQAAGMSRSKAAKHIANNISANLAIRISRKPVTPRAVEEWLDRFGGDHAEDTAARRAYRVWSRGEPASAIKIREITERIGKTLPVRKPR